MPQVWTIQVKAARQRSEADGLAAHLAAQGYDTRVIPAVSAGQPVFRVRVGRFSGRAEAEAVATRLATEEHVDTWLIRLSTAAGPAVP